MVHEHILTEEDATAAALGGTVLGGGGGGSRRLGEKMGIQAVQTGRVRLLPIEALSPDAILLTVSAVGAPAAKNACASPTDYVRAVERFIECFDVRPAGIITNECGGNATMNGWIQAAQLQLPLVDAPCNGRAHPTGVMGAMGLHLQAGFVSRQVAVGGSKACGSYIEMAAAGSLTKASGLVRLASIEAEGLVAVARNPVPASYVKKNAAPGAIARCIALGKKMLKLQKENKDIPAGAADFLQGEICMEGCIRQLQLETRKGFDVGSFTIVREDCSMEMSFWNEYMTLETGEKRIGTFPDLLMTFEAASGLPISSAEIREGMNIKILHVSSKNMQLGAGMLDPVLFEPAEAAVGKDIRSYVFKNKEEIVWH